MPVGGDIREQAKKDALAAPAHEAGQVPCPCWELRVGIFFDGTANNMEFDFDQQEKELEDEARRRAEEVKRTEEAENSAKRERTSPLFDAATQKQRGAFS